MSEQVVTGSDLRWPVRFENQTKAGNTSGGQEETPFTFLNARCKAVKATGGRDLENGAPRLINVYDFYTYWRSDLEAFVNKDTRIIYDNRVYRIETYERLQEDRRYFHFFASEAH